ncbi:MAG: SwmB domain-containing protein, partial [Acidobacteria bacterium]|nr:SwmB domain-containing protein [Acidobacteriota bacterium]
MPTFASATVDGAALTITFNEHIDPTSVPAPGAFEVQVGGGARSVDSGGVAITDDTVTLTLSSAVAAGETVTVAYTKPGSNPLQDYARNDVASFAAQTVTNDTVRLPIITIAPAATLASLSAVDEGTAAVFTVTADFAPTADLTVNLTVADAAGSDFVAETDQFAKTVTITANTKTADHSVPTTNDTIDEPDGDVLVTVEPHADYVVGDPSSASVRVFDGDVPADTLVSNNEQTPRADAPIGFTSSGFESFAAAFSTGSPGAVISAVDLRLGADGVGSEAALVVSLYSTTAAGAPDASLFVFDNPVGFAANTVNTFTVPTDAGSSATLAANTTYAIVLETASTAQNENNQVDFAFTREDGEDSGAAAGWSIADASHSKIGSGNWSALSTGFTATIGVRGTLLDAAAPTFGSAKVDGARLVIVFSEELDPDSVPAPGAFNVQVASSARTVADGGVRIDGSAVTLTLSSAVTAGQTVTVAYTKPSDDPLQDLSGNPVATFTAQSVAVRLANAPEGLEVEAGNNLDLIVRWEPPANLPADHAVTGYTVEWTPAGGTATTADVGSDVRAHRVTSLTEGTAYTARVQAKITNSSNPGNPVNTTAWSVTSAPVTIWQEPIVGWFVDGTPNFNTQIGRLFFLTDDNMFGGSGLCEFVRIVGSGPDGTGTINCVPNTLTSLDTTTGADHVFEVSVTAFIGGTGDLSTATMSSISTFVGQVGGGAASVNGYGPTAGTLARASGGNGRLVVGWTRVSSNSTVGNVDAVVVETRRQNNDGSWPDWTQTVIEGALADVKEGSYAFNGLDNGTYQVRVRGRTDGDDGDADTTDIPRLGFTTPVQTVTVAAANTNRAGSPTSVRVTGSGTTRTVTWEPPADATVGAVVYGYQVRHRETTATNDGDWTESAELYPRQIRRYCQDDLTCANPRSYTISGLTASTGYDVEVVALNANSALADDMTAPSFSAAAVNGKALTLSFDEALDPNSAPAPGDFTVTVGTEERDVAAGGVAIKGATVTLTLDSPVLATDTVKVAYTKPASNPLRDSAVNAVATFTDQSVFNTTGSAVSNASQVDAELSTANDFAQAFTTGSHPGGYTLSRVDVLMEEGTTSPVYGAIGIHADASNLPGASEGTLTLAISSLPATRGVVALNASDTGIALQPNTTYWLVMDAAGISNASIWGTSSDTEDAGAAKGWSIADTLRGRAPLATTWTAPAERSLVLAIHATPNPTTVLVGNFGQPDGGDVNALNDHAQAFTTGPSDHGWTLTQVDLEMLLSSGSNPPPYTVKIHADSSGSPGTALADGTLTQQGTVGATAAKIRFTSDGVELDAETTYWIVFDIGALGLAQLSLGRTTGQDEDAGAAAGFSIADTRSHRTANTTGAWTTESANVLKIAVHGSAATAQELVSNIGQASDVEHATSVDFAQAFTTGTDRGGYSLTHVNAVMKQNGTHDWTGATAGVHVDSNGVPGDLVGGGSLTPDAVPGAAKGPVVFSASDAGVALDAETTYWFVLDLDAARTFTTYGTTSDAENTGAVSGWAIADTALGRLTLTDNWDNPNRIDDALQIAVFGNILPDTTPPEFSSAVVDGAALTVTFDEDLDDSSLPAPGDFTVTVGADRRDVAAGGVAIAGDTVTLTLSSPVLAVDAVQVRYTA